MPSRTPSGSSSQGRTLWRPATSILMRATAGVASSRIARSGAESFRVRSVRTAGQNCISSFDPIRPNLKPCDRAMPSTSRCRFDLAPRARRQLPCMSTARSLHCGRPRSCRFSLAPIHRKQAALRPLAPTRARGNLSRKTQRRPLHRRGTAGRSTGARNYAGYGLDWRRKILSIEGLSTFARGASVGREGRGPQSSLPRWQERLCRAASTRRERTGDACRRRA